jgi:hypothetical protein
LRATSSRPSPTSQVRESEEQPLFAV